MGFVEFIKGAVEDGSEDLVGFPVTFAYVGVIGRVELRRVHVDGNALYFVKFHRLLKYNQ